MTNMIKIDFASKANATYTQLLASRGTPTHVLHHKLALTAKSFRSATNPIDKKIITAQKQFEGLLSFLKNPKQQIVVVSSLEGNGANVMFAASLMLHFTKYFIKQTELGRPFMYRVYGGRYDKLRDDLNFKATIGLLNCLVLYNIADNSTLDKIEKVRDLLYMYENVPRVIVLDSDDPLKFCKDILRMQPNLICNIQPQAVTVQL